MYVEWRLRTRKWDDSTGQTRYTTEVVVENFIFLDSRPAHGDDDLSHDHDMVTEEEELPF